MCGTPNSNPNTITSLKETVDPRLQENKQFVFLHPNLFIFFKKSLNRLDRLILVLIIKNSIGHINTKNLKLLMKTNLMHVMKTRLNLLHSS